MNILNKFPYLKRLAEVKNLNELAREDQKRAVMLVVFGIITLVMIGWIFLSPKTSKKLVEEPMESTMVGTLDSQFNVEASQKALEAQQNQIKDLTDQLTMMNAEMISMQQALGESNSSNGTDAIQILQTRIAEL